MNNINYNRMFNGEIKKEFIENNYNTEDGQRVIANTFYKTQLTESILQRDLNTFSAEQIIGVIRSLELSTYYSIKNATTLIKNYIDWCYENAYITSNINVSRIVNDDDILRGLISTIHKQTWTDKEIEDIVDNQVNGVQLKAMIQIIFEGVYGTELSEIRNLKIADVYTQTNTLILTNLDGSMRELKVSDKAIKLLEEANSTGSYTDETGTVKVLMSSEYIFKKAENNSRGRRTDSDDAKMTRIQLLNRLKKFNEVAGTPKFTPNNIHKSGMLYVYLTGLKAKNEGKLDYKYPTNIVNLENKEMEDLLAKKFSWSVLESARGYTFYNTGNMKRSFLNIDNVIDLYKKELAAE